MGRQQALTSIRAIPQAGFSLLAFVVLLAMVGMTWYIGSLAANTQTLKLDRDRVTQTAFAKAKEALISFAAANPDRGALPCPADPANEGVMLTSCPTDALRIGRLPWRTLGIEDLRDGGGESLWYAVSANFSPDAPTINSDVSLPTLTVNGTTSYAAIVFSPGSVLGPQQRTNTAAGCATTGGSLRQDYCAANYLDLDTVSGISNGDGDTTFVQTRNDTFNDTLTGITPAEVFSVVEKRVLRQVRSCLVRYASQPGNTSGLFPWAHKVDPVGPDPGDKTLAYADTDATLIGRVADNLTTSGFLWTGPDCPLPSCAVTGFCTPTKNWLKDWRELVFYAVSPEYAPGGPGSGTAGSLTVGSTPGVRAVVFLAGPRLGAQVRVTPSDRGTPANYLEGLNNANYLSLGPFDNGPVTGTYNDRTLVVAP